MKTELKILVFLVLAFTVFSCEKYVPVIEAPPLNPISICQPGNPRLADGNLDPYRVLISPASFVIHDPDYQVNFHGEPGKTIQAVQWGPDPYYSIYRLDLNKDHIDDLEFSVLRTRISSPSFEKVTETGMVSCLNNETKVMARDVHLIYPVHGQLDTVNYTEPIVFAPGDSLNENIRREGSNLQFFITFNYDNYMVSGQDYSYNADNWSSFDSHYMGISFTHGSHQLYGWVKISIVGHKITINRYVLKSVS